MQLKYGVKLELAGGEKAQSESEGGQDRGDLSGGFSQAVATTYPLKGLMKAKKEISTVNLVETMMKEIGRLQSELAKEKKVLKVPKTKIMATVNLMRKSSISGFSTPTNRRGADAPAQATPGFLPAPGILQQSSFGRSFKMGKQQSIDNSPRSDAPRLELNLSHSSDSYNNL
jgi:hypothetical protein